MSEMTVSQNETYIKVERIGHFYYLDERQQGFVIAMNQKVHRDAAIAKVEEATGGQMPEVCNFDVCQGRRWSWEMKDHMKLVAA